MKILIFMIAFLFTVPAFSNPIVTPTPREPEDKKGGLVGKVNKISKTPEGEAKEADAGIEEPVKKEENTKAEKATYCGIEGQFCRIGGKAGRCIEQECADEKCDIACIDEKEANAILAAKAPKVEEAPKEKPKSCATGLGSPYSAGSLLFGLFALVALRRRR